MKRCVLVVVRPASEFGMGFDLPAGDNRKGLWSCDLSLWDWTPTDRKPIKHSSESTGLVKTKDKAHAEAVDKARTIMRALRAVGRPAYLEDQNTDLWKYDPDLLTNALEAEAQAKTRKREADDLRQRARQLDKEAAALVAVA